MRGGTQIKCHSVHLLSIRAFLQNGLFCGGSLLLRLHFDLSPLLPTLGPGAGSSHPGNLRRQGLSPAVPARSPHPPQVGIQFGDGGACGKLVSSTRLPSPLPPPPPSPVPVMLPRRPPGSASLSSPLHPSPSVGAKCVWASGSRSPAGPTVFSAAPSRDARAPSARRIRVCA